MKKWIVTPEEIIEGKTTDIYFIRALNCLKKDNLDQTKVWVETTTSNLPRNWDEFMFLGLSDVVSLFEKAKLKINVYAIAEGTIIPCKDINGVKIPVLTVEGAYGNFAIYETPMLGLLCFQSGVGTSAMRVRIAAKNRTLLSFGIRRMHPTIAPIIDRGCYIAGFDGVSCVISAEKLGINATGTMPHSFIMIEGGIEQAMRSYEEHIEEDIMRIALSDTFNDERFEALKALEAIGEKLQGIRLDTPGSRKGNFREIIQEIRWEFKQKGRDDIKIFLSGGFNEDTVKEFNDIADGFGVGTSVANSPTVDFAFDIVEIEGNAIAKRGKFAGRKQVGSCKKCDIYLCEDFWEEEIICPECKQPMKKLLKEVMRNGEKVKELPEEDEIRSFVKEQLRV